MSTTTASQPQPSYIAYGPDANCTLSVCSINLAVYNYRPSVPANATILALFALSLIISLIQGWKWRTYGFTIAIFWGYIAEIIGYVGRLILYNNPFSFTGFLMQIMCITLAPAFYSAGIYLTLSKITYYLDPNLSITRFKPTLYYWLFIPCDIVSLCLQGAGGGLSSSSSGSSQTGVDMALAGLSFQVITLTVFCVLALDFAVRCRRHHLSQNGLEGGHQKLNMKFKLFIGFLSLAILCILIRCVYRIDELSNGYSGPLIQKQGLFIGLEGVMIVIAVFCFNACYPGIGEVFAFKPSVGLEAGKQLSAEESEK